MARLLLLYDGGCAFCRRCVRFVREHDRDQVVELVRSDAPGVGERTGLRPADLEASVWTVDSDGTRRRGAAAVNRTLRELGSGFRLLASAGQVPPLGWLEERGYRFVAARRSWFSRLWSDPPGPPPPDR